MSLRRRPPSPPNSIELVRSLCAKIVTLDIDQSLILPIKSIKNINVGVTIRKDTADTYTVRVLSVNFILYCPLFEENYTQSNEERIDLFILKMVCDLLVKLKKLVIDRLNGVFCFASPDLYANEELMLAFISEFKDHDSIKLNIDECCVCYNPTRTITNCGHALCLECISNFPSSSLMLECPLCRQIVIALQLGCISQ
jgi:hypothetical protein